MIVDMRIRWQKAAYHFFVDKLHKAKSILFRWVNLRKSKYAR